MNLATDYTDCTDSKREGTHCLLIRVIRVILGFDVHRIGGNLSGALSLIIS